MFVPKEAQYPTDWFYRNLFPKGTAARLEYRRKIIERCAHDVEAQIEAEIICSRDMLYWINVFGWTFDPKEHSEQPIRAFLTYEYQNDGFTKVLQPAIGSHDIAAPKSRTMGATWMCLIAMLHRWKYMPRQSFLLSSRKDELVDKTGDEKALFQKLDFFLDHLPKWMVPDHTRLIKHLRNNENGSAFDGEATVDNLGTGDRRTAILLDETSKMPGAEKIFTSTREVTNCRIFNSTPYGTAGVGKPFYLRVKNPATVKLFMHWSDHPDKRVGLYALEDGRKVPLPEDYDWRDDYDFDQLCFPERRPRSAWYDVQCERSDTQREIEQELDINFLTQSQKFADPEVIRMVRDKHVRPPSMEGHLSVDDEEWQCIWNPAREGPFKLWVPCDGSSPQQGEYAIGADVATGSGGPDATESGLIVWDCRTAELVGQFATRDMTPEVFGRYAVGVCKWFHNAFLIPEVTGPGAQFVRAVREIGYGNVYVRDADMISSLSSKKLRKIGVHNNDRGTLVLSGLMDAMRRNRAIVRSERVVAQLFQYEWAADGKVIHGSVTDDDGQKTHGDIAIAAATGFLGVRERPAREEPQPEETEYPMWSIGWRHQQMEEEKVESEFAW